MEKRKGNSFHLPRPPPRWKNNKEKKLAFWGSWAASVELTPSCRRSRWPTKVNRAKKLFDYYVKNSNNCGQILVVDPRLTVNQVNQIRCGNPLTSRNESLIDLLFPRSPVIPVKILHGLGTCFFKQSYDQTEQSLSKIRELCNGASNCCPISEPHQRLMGVRIRSTILFTASLVITSVSCWRML